MNKAKGRQSAKHARSGKYLKAFLNCVVRTGRWRGKPATTDMARSANRSMLTELTGQADRKRGKR